MLTPGHLAGSERVAVVAADRGRAWTYRELMAATRRMGARLAGRDRLAFVFCRKDFCTILHYLACLEAACPVALLDEGLADEAKLELVGRYRPEWILGSFAQKWLPQGFGVSEVTFEEGRMWRREGGEAGPLHPDLAVLLSTSGTLGSPRFVRLSRRNVRSNTAAIIRALGIGAEDRAIISLPIHYSYGLSVLNTHLAAGASVVLTEESLVSPRFWAACREAGATSLAGVPYSYHLLERMRMDFAGVPSLRTLTQAGGALGAELTAKYHEAMRRRDGRFFVMYGQTEATARMAVLPAEDLPAKLGSAGLPVRGGKFEIRRGDGTLTSEAGAEGELVYTGENVMMGYATGRGCLAAGDDLRGTLRTGDVCRLDEGGYLYVRGRLDRDVKLFGLRINLDEVESLLREHGPAAAVAGEERLRVFCEGGGAEGLAARLGLHPGAVVVNRVEKLPRHPNGKINYALLDG